LLLAESLVLVFKLGSDMNYFLHLRVVEAMACGALWHAVHAAERRPRARSVALGATTALAIVVITPSLLGAVILTSVAWRNAMSLDTPDGRRMQSSHRFAIALAQDPRVRLLTDSGLLDLYQGERAAFGDPYLFRKLVELRLLRPTTIEQWIESGYYDMVITNHDLESPLYVEQDFRLPMDLVERIRAHYVLREVQPELFYYGRRGEAWPPAGLFDRRYTE
jgi:hypothetical protein